ncbi:hypothetical protein MAR_030709 [Mya arenaria]|uniref:Uncharacterized protein n=1 Tax=Mya arenaria TaxID=6604 RepID=A0ABY7F1Q3_MYAAR|nr:hypothetical protein MAR_030709 [Mya arenaria]
MEIKAQTVFLKIVLFVSFGFYLCGDGRNQQTEETNSGSVIGGAVGGVLAEYEIPDSEPRSELTIEGEDNRVYYNDERTYYKNVGGNVHKT